ncbi:MAG TPA: hypothetical protein VLE91_01170, partial [Candidatus Saccharimonadales bacterium]|nr:hypothetical protein [Candidatus Saccharimonadales bacterium]
MAKQKTASTQEHLDIEDIMDDLVILKTGWVALVMSTTAVNFDLLSEAEQDATIYAYGAFLNSLSFPLEVLVRSKKADITSYFQNLEEAEASLPNPDLKRQIQKYKDFIQSTVQQKTVLDKKFYLIVNYSPLEAGFAGVGKSKGTTQAKNKASILLDAKAALAPKRDHVIKQTARLGLITKQLATQELIELFYDIYNPAPMGTQRVLLDTQSYTTPMVEPALEIPEPAPVLRVANAPTSKAASSIAQMAPIGFAPNMPAVGTQVQAPVVQNPTNVPPPPTSVSAQPAPLPVDLRPVAPQVVQPKTPTPLVQAPPVTPQRVGFDAVLPSLQQQPIPHSPVVETSISQMRA